MWMISVSGYLGKRRNTRTLHAHTKFNYIHWWHYYSSLNEYCISLRLIGESEISSLCALWIWPGCDITRLWCLLPWQLHLLSEQQSKDGKYVMNHWIYFKIFCRATENSRKFLLCIWSMVVNHAKLKTNLSTWSQNSVPPFLALCKENKIRKSEGHYLYPLLMKAALLQKPATMRGDNRDERKGVTSEERMGTDDN